MSTDDDSRDAVCTIAFEGEAHEQAADAIRRMETFCARVTVGDEDDDPRDEEVVIGPVSTDVDGFYVVELYPWDKEASEGDRARAFSIDLYRMERLLIL